MTFCIALILLLELLDNHGVSGQADTYMVNAEVRDQLPT
jgi:hypothetical protein